MNIGTLKRKSMKHILIVAEQKSSVESMLKKAIRFSSNKISLVFFTQDTSEEKSIEIKELVDKLISSTCETTIILDSAQTTVQKSEKLIQKVSVEKFDTIFLHRPSVKDATLDLSFIKATLRAPIKSTIFLCGDNKWRPKMSILGTLDILDKSTVQHELTIKY